MLKIRDLPDIEVKISAGSATFGRQITQCVFHGNGDPDATKLTERRLADAFSIVSGLQQPDHPESEQEADDCQDFRAAATIDLYCCALDILAALGITPKELAVFEHASTTTWQRVIAEIERTPNMERS
jgi:hypothetical protein